MGQNPFQTRNLGFHFVLNLIEVTLIKGFIWTRTTSKISSPGLQDSPIKILIYSITDFHITSNYLYKRELYRPAANPKPGIQDSTIVVLIPGRFHKLFIWTRIHSKTKNLGFHDFRIKSN